MIHFIHKKKTKQTKYLAVAQKPISLTPTKNVLFYDMWRPPMAKNDRNSIVHLHLN